MGDLEGSLDNWNCEGRLLSIDVFIDVCIRYVWDAPTIYGSSGSVDKQGH